MKQSCNEPLMLDFIRDVHYSEAYYLPAREAIKKHFPELFQIPKEKVKKRFVRKHAKWKKSQYPEWDTGFFMRF